MADLTKTEVVLELVDEGDRLHITFGSGADDGTDPEEVFTLDMPVEVWSDMDRPVRVTVTIEPGDRLNEASGHPVGEEGQT